ncbi:P-loop containing nucleoside triphosphate hydrolase protein [Aspergillus crustosus]
MPGDRSSRHDPEMNSTSTPTSGKKSHKRKRDLDATAVSSSTPTKKSKKDWTESSSSAPLEESKKKKKRSAPASADSQEEPTSTNGADDKPKKKSKSERRKSSGKDRDSDGEPADTVMEDDDSGRVKGKDTGKAKKQKQSKAADQTEKGNEPSQPKNKFAGILSKFERSAKVKEAAAEQGYQTDKTQETDVNTAEPVIAQGLEPIPQPEPVAEQVAAPTYSSLPAWLANPVRASADSRSKFSDLGIEPKLLRLLEDNGYKEAFAVQSTVIPLLLKGPKNHSGDICVSAATGSGKTLSYVLPLVTELEQTPAPRLRGLIVVPTRELVKQAREACELCTAGSGLRVGSAVGNVAIKDEQRSLMRVDQVYSPENITSRQKAKLTGDDWTEFGLQDYISNTLDLGETLPGYIHKPEPNVDILICTPGRLVDHIRYTKGFTLKHLQWLVIDEADRLLNESFQEWVDVVMNSLDARNSPDAFGSSGQFLSQLGLPLQTKEPRKVVLSATMTRDISKLNSLRLINPRLVIVGASESSTTGDGEGDVAAHSDEKFTLPTTLKEYSVAVGDGAQKPLYLLRLLSEIKIATPSSAKRTKRATSESDEASSEGTSSDETSSDDTSSDETSSDDSSEDSSSESSSDESDSDAESDTSDSSSSSEDSESSNSSSDSESDIEESTKTPAKHASQRSTVLVFTKSSESASRLSRLLTLLDPSLSDLIGTIIKSNKSSASRKTLTAYRQGKLSIMIATDRASRGLDLQSLTHVVNYDVPASITTYVHRVGRTARADKEGSAWTLVAHREGRWFTNEIAKGADGKITRASKVERVPMKLENMKEVKSRYASALEVLEAEVKTGGANGGRS